MAEYRPISIFPKKMTFNKTIPKSIIVGLYSFIKIPAKSDPPVDECALKISAVPNPC